MDGSGLVFQPRYTAFSTEKQLGDVAAELMQRPWLGLGLREDRPGGGDGRPAPLMMLCADRIAFGGTRICTIELNTFVGAVIAIPAATVPYGACKLSWCKYDTYMYAGSCRQPASQSAKNVKRSMNRRRGAAPTFVRDTFCRDQISALCKHVTVP